MISNETGTTGLVVASINPTLTDVTIDDLVTFTETAGDATCAGGDYWIKGNSSTNTMRGCENGTAFDVNTTAGSASWSSLTAPTGAVTMDSDNNAEIVQFNYTSDLGATDVAFQVEQLTGNPVAGSILFGLTYADPDITPFSITDGTDTLTINTALDTISTDAAQLVLEQTGDMFGTVRLILGNRTGLTGAQFEQAGSVDLVDFQFKTLSNTWSVRLEDRAGSTFLLDPEFQFGQGGNPSFLIGISAVAVRPNNPAPLDAFTIMRLPGASPSQSDGHYFVQSASSDDGSPHTIDWRRWVDVTSNAGASILTWQSRIDAASFADRMTLTDAGELTPVKLSFGAASDVSLERTSDPNTVLGIAQTAGSVFGLPVVAGDPNTATWGTGQDGRAWFNSTSNLWRGWDGSAIQTIGPGAGGNVDLLDGSVHQDTAAASVTRGGIVVGKTATPVWDLLTIGGANTFLGSDATDATWTSLTLASAQFANQGTTIQVLHGNASGNPSWGSVVAADLAAGFIDATTDLAAGLCGANTILERQAAVWACIATPSGGAVRWDELNDPTSTVLMTSSTVTELFDLDFQANYTAELLFDVRTTTGTPSGGVLANFQIHDSDVTILRAWDGTNGVEVSGAGILSALSTGGVDWAALLNYPTGCTNQFVVIIADTLTCDTVTAADTDETTFTGVTWGANADFVWNFNTVGGSNPDSVISFTGANINVSTGVLQEGGVNVVVDSFTITSGNGLSGGGDLTSNLTLVVDLNETVDGVGSSSNLSGMEFTATGELALLQDCATGQILKYTTTGDLWECQNDDDSGGSPAWEALVNTADTATSYVSTADAETVTFDFQSAFSTDRFIIQDSTGNPTAGTLLQVTVTDPQVEGLRVEKNTTDEGSFFNISNSNTASRAFMRVISDTAQGGIAAYGSTHATAADETWFWSAGASGKLLIRQDGAKPIEFWTNGSEQGTISSTGAWTIGGTLEAGTLTESSNAVPNATDHLGFFAATTSLQFIDVISDETGTGLAVFDDDPLFSNQVRFTAIAAPSYVAGQLFYDSTDQALSFHNDESDVALQIGQEGWIRVRNVTGSTINNGQVVYIVGIDSGLPSIALARADAMATAQAVGIATHSIEDTTNGYVTAYGLVRDFDTLAFTVADRLYLSASTAGLMTNTAPSDPNFVVPIAIVTEDNATTGDVLVTLAPPRPTGGAGIQVLGNSISTLSSEENFLVSGALSCGANTAGKMQTHTTPLQYCDNAGPPVLQYAAYGAIDGDALAGDDADSFFDAGTIGVARGGTNLASGTDGGILGFTATGTLASSALLTANALVLGGGAGATPSTPVGLGTTTTLLHGNVGGAPSYGSVVDGDISANTITAASVAAPLKTFDKSIVIIDPTTGEDDKVQWMHGKAVTYTDVDCSTDAGTVTIDMDHRVITTPNTVGTDILTGTIVCDTDNQADGGFADATIPANVPVNLSITGVSGAGTVRIHIRGTVD
jgi:hypothetical protein